MNCGNWLKSVKKAARKAASLFYRALRLFPFIRSGKLSKPVPKCAIYYPLPIIFCASKYMLRESISNPAPLSLFSRVRRDAADVSEASAALRIRLLAAARSAAQFLRDFIGYRRFAVFPVIRLDIGPGVAEAPTDFFVWRAAHFARYNLPMSAA